MSEIRPTDQDIEHAIRGRLAAHPELNPANLSFHVAAGCVRLEGTAVDDEQHRRTIEVVSGVPGVRDVVDEMTIVGGSVGSRP
jgi:osmotically-inducible protein OsmY